MNTPYRLSNKSKGRLNMPVKRSRTISVQNSGNVFRIGNGLVPKSEYRKAFDENKNLARENSSLKQQVRMLEKLKNEQKTTNLFASRENGVQKLKDDILELRSQFENMKLNLDSSLAFGATISASPSSVKDTSATDSGKGSELSFAEESLSPDIVSVFDTAFCREDLDSSSEVVLEIAKRKETLSGVAKIVSKESNKENIPPSNARTKATKNSKVFFKVGRAGKRTAFQNALQTEKNVIAKSLKLNDASVYDFDPDID